MVAEATDAVAKTILTMAQTVTGPRRTACQISNLCVDCLANDDNDAHTLVGLKNKPLP